MGRSWNEISMKISDELLFSKTRIFGNSENLKMRKHFYETKIRIYNIKTQLLYPNRSKYILLDHHIFLKAIHKKCIRAVFRASGKSLTADSDSHHGHKLITSTQTLSNHVKNNIYKSQVLKQTPNLLVINKHPHWNFSKKF